MQRELIQPYIELAEQWYHNHIDKGISPIMTEADHDWLKSELEFMGK
jgi:hypothetical protein